MVRWLGEQWHSHPTRVQVLVLTPVLAFFWIYSGPFGDVRSVEGHVPADYKCVYGDFVNLKKMVRLSLSGYSSGGGVGGVHRDECVCICMSVYVCTMLRKHGSTRTPY